MNEYMYDKIVELQNLSIKQSNILAEIIEQLNELAISYERAAEEARK